MVIVIIITDWIILDYILIIITTTFKLCVKILMLFVGLPGWFPWEKQAATVKHHLI